MIKNVLLSCSLGFMIAFSAMGADNILIDDFEGSDFGGWTAEGNAFGNAPSEADEPGVLGEFAARSRGSGMGTLTSPPFTIERDAIYFLMNTREHAVTGAAGDVGVQLLLDGEVVRTMDASGPSYRFHAMFWEAWDVSEFKGQAARFRIFDNSDWSNIGIDHIIQSDIPAERPVLERTITVTKAVLNFPLKTGAVRHYIELFVDGKQVRAMDVGLATDDIDYWVVTDLSPWLGKEVVMRTRQHPLANAQILDRISVEDGIRDADDLYNEALRPQFHFSSQRGWVNDPNGLVYYDGEYHLYYQSE